MDSHQQVPPRPVPRGLPAYVAEIRDWLTDPRVRVGALLVAAAIAGYFWYQVGQTDSSGALPAAPSISQRPRRPTFRSTTTTKPPYLVHVAGAVAHPGLVRVPSGARIADAIAAAGGGLPDADLDRLNLAAKVADGQRIPVAKIGAPGATSAGAPGDGSATGTDPPADGAAGGTSASGPVDLNTATETQLETLPGIGPSFAAAIIRERERRGGFTSVDQLRDVRGIGEKRFAELKPLVSV